MCCCFALSYIYCCGEQHQGILELHHVRVSTRLEEDNLWKERSELRMSTLSPMLNSRDVPLDKHEFQTFYQENVSLIYRYMYHKVGNREEAEDLTSHVFLKAVSSIDHERSRLSMQKWLFLIARTTMADYWRTHYRLPLSSLDELLDAGWEGPITEEPTVASDSAAESNTPYPSSIARAVSRGLALSFSPQTFDKSYCVRMGVTVGNVKVLQFRALKRAANLEQVVAE